jgi:hypothetical protein
VRVDNSSTKHPFFHPPRTRHRCVPEDRAAQGTLAQEMVPNLFREEVKPVPLEVRQGLATGAGVFLPSAATQEPVPKSADESTIAVAISVEESAHVAPTNVQRGMEATPLARTHDSVRWSVTPNLQLLESAEHSQRPPNELALTHL